MSAFVRASVRRLRRLVDILEAGGADEQWLAAGLAQYFAEALIGGRSLEFYLDLAPSLGGSTWVEQERLDQRNALLHDMATHHFPGLRPGPAARAIMAAWFRYCRNRLAGDRRRGESADAPGTLGSDLYELARLDGPPAERQVRNVLAAAGKQPDAA